MNIAVAGLGFMGSTHLKAWRSVPQARIAAVMSSDPKKLDGDLSAIQGNLGGAGEKMDFAGAKKYEAIEPLLRDPEIDAVDICLPTHLHAPVAIAALRAGKHVLVEKPMALDAVSADEMIAEAQRCGRILMVGQVLRFAPSYRLAAELVKSGRLGRVRSALFRRRCAAPSWSAWLSDPAKSGGGVFDLLIHDVDYCIHLLGIPEFVSATGSEDLPAGIDFIAASLHYPGRGPGSGPVIVTGGWHHPKAYPFSMEFTVICDGGTLEYSSAGRPLTLYGANGSEETLDSSQEDLFAAELQYFAECAAAGLRPERCPPEESAAAVRLTRLMLESRARSGQNVSWAEAIWKSA